MVRQSAFRLALLLAIGGSVLTGCGGSEPPGPESVVLIDIGSGDRRALVEGASGPAWSADGARIAFVSRGPMPSIELIRPDGTGRRPLKTVAGSSVVGLSWAPGGGRIAACVAAIEAPGSPMRLWILDPAGGGQRKIFEAAGGRAACDPPAWSPDGGRIAFVGPPGRDLRVIDPDGGRAPAIAPSDDDGSEPLWPAGGRSLLVTARPPTGMARIDEVFLDGRRRTVVADVFGGAEASPDGRRIAALATDEEDRRVRPRVFARDGRRIAQIELEGQRLAWSPDGRSLAIGAREGLFVVSADGGSPRRIAGFERPVFTGIDWSPDGGTLAVSWFREGRGD